MGERFRISLPMGMGLDRATGRTVIRPGAMRDLRNVYLFDGKILVRRGMEETATFVDDEGDPCTHIMGGGPQRTERVGIVIGYRQPTGKVFIYRTTSLGTVPERLDVLHPVDGLQRHWFALAPNSAPPTFEVTDSYGRLFMAHAHPTITGRAPTVYYDPGAVPPIQPLRAGWADDAPIYFRGVRRHLNYLLGWGWGTPDEDRPERVRVSNPGEPLTFEEPSYWTVGQRGEPVLAVVAGRRAIAHKESDTHVLLGTSQADFGVEIIDADYGVPAHRLALPWRGGSLFWSAEGPRWINTDGPSIDMALPLDLEGFEPEDLVVSGDIALGFAVHLPARRIVEFIFGQRGYAMTYQNPEEPRWSYTERAVPVYCAFALYHSTVSQGGTGAQKPQGYPKALPVSEWAADAISDFVANLRMEHVGAVGVSGVEVLEVWLKPAGGLWALHTPVQVQPSQPRQEVRLLGLAPDTDYAYAMRYRSGNLYADGYEGDPDTPDNWTAATAAESKGTFKTTQVLRVLESAVWSRIDALTEQILLTWSGGPASETRAQRSADDGATYAPIAGSPFASGVVQHAYAPAPTETEKALHFKVNATAGGVDGPDSAVLRVWVGPLPPRGVPGTLSGTLNQPLVEWYDLLVSDPWGSNVGSDPNYVGLRIRWSGVAVDPDLSVEVHVDEGGGYPPDPNQTLPSTETEFNAVVARGTPIKVKLRVKSVVDGVDDFSEFTNEWTGGPF
jgi:hypothetical protein